MAPQGQEQVEKDRIGNDDELVCPECGGHIRVDDIECPRCGMVLVGG
jgi:DNA-directed RNA polymerase subunit RPC12/RpoP